MGRKKAEDKEKPPVVEEGPGAVNPEEQNPQEEREAPVDDIQKLKSPTQTDEEELKKLLKDAEKTFGEGVIASAEELLETAKVSSRNLLLDILTKGGLPKGSITLFFGDESSGKSFQTFLLASVFTSQKIPVLYIACEGDFSKTWVAKLGNDLKYFYISKPSSLDKAIDIADIATRSKQFGLIIFDSVTAGISQDVIDKSAAEKQMADQAKLNDKLCKKLTAGLQPSNLKDPNTYNDTIVILIAHTREKVGIVYGNPITIPGGHALKQHSSYIITFKKCKILTQDDKPVGREMNLTITKAKYSKPYGTGLTELYFEPPRLNNAKIMLTYGIQLGVIQKAGTYYSYGDIKAQGQKELILALKEKPGVLAEIKLKLIEKYHK